MFARIAPTYDLLNHLLSMGRDRAWRRLVADNLGPSPHRVLDLCAGTGDLALEIVRRAPQAAVVSGDFCFEMLARGRENTPAHATRGLRALQYPSQRRLSTP
jgi:demethylmenaquinone methyltransferase/2-methoxy-6-polyprenyl-1,4-benzoquinol methylase